MHEARQADGSELAEFDRLPQVSMIEVDRFCDGCGYNLRGQAVRRDTRTKLLLCRCPECGQFHHAREQATVGRAWLNRLAMLGLLIWIGTVAGTVVMLGFAQALITTVPLEEFTIRRHIPVTSQPGTQPSTAAPTVFQIGAAGQVTLSMPSGTTTTYRAHYTVNEDWPYKSEFTALMLASSFGTGVTLAVLLVVVCHHWRRWGYYVPVVLVTVAPALIVFSWWRAMAPELTWWGAWYITAHAAAFLAGGLTGIRVGRPLARLVANLLLPPKLRAPLAFLWLVDGKSPNPCNAEPS